MHIKEIRKRTGWTQKRFAEYFGVPLRTVQQWERNGSVPPQYIPQMMERILDLEEQLKEKEETL